MNLKGRNLKFVLFLSLIFVLTINNHASNTTDILKKSQNLVHSKKYESAFQILEKFDPLNENPEIVLLKVDIVLNYFVTSVMHQIFSLKDIGQTENIMDYRGKNSTSNAFKFEINKILSRLIKINPENYKLYKALGEFYHDVHIKYGDNWLIKTDEILRLIQQNLKIVNEKNAGDYYSDYILGYTYLLNKNYKNAILHLRKSTGKKPENPLSNYNLAYAYLHSGDLINSLKYAKVSFNKYKNKKSKAESARMVGIISEELNQLENSVKYLEISNNIVPGDYYTLKHLLNIYIKTGNVKSGSIRKQFFLLGTENPSIYNGLSDVYFKNEKELELAKFYLSLITEYRTNKKIIGNSYFYLGQIYYNHDRKKCSDYFRKAKETFKMVFSEDHNVFKVIDDMIKKTK